MKKIVINKCYGGFGLSYAGVMKYAELKGFTLYAYGYDRSGPNGLDLRKMIPYDGTGDDFLTHYYRKPIVGDVKDNDSYWYSGDILRDDPVLVQVVTELGKEANGYCGSLAVVEIPDGIEWEIDEYDGMETIDEKHQSWS